jgi:hypothetical protein
MNNYRGRTHESGSLATFLVVGLVLAVLVIGGVYTLQKKGQHAPSKPTASPTVAKSPSKSPQPAPSHKPTPPKPVATPSHGPIAKAPNGNPLPATGPSDNFVSILMLAGLVGLAIAYVRSRTARQFAYQLD